MVEQLKLEADNEAGSGPATDHLLDECLKIASMGSLYQSRRNLELNKRIMELDRRIMELDSALQTSQAEVVRVTTEWQKLHANHVQAVAERDAYHAKYRRLRDFLVTVYQIFPLKFFMPLGPIDPKSGEFRLK
jgi:hypothetical protein